MRTLTINGCTFDSRYATKFIEAGHRQTSKTRPHWIAITFNNWNLSENRVGKEVDYLLDLLYQAFIIKNEIKSLVITVDERKKDDITLEIS